MLRKILFIAALFIATVLLMALQKPLFLLWYAPLAADATAAELLAVSWHGLLLDSTTAGYLCVVPLLVMIATVWAPIPERTVRRILNAYFALMSAAVAVIVAVDLGLYRYWGFRLDDTVLFYLRTPEEAAASVTWHDVWPQIIVTAAYTALMIFVYRRIAALYTADTLRLWRRIGATLVLLFGGGLLFLAIRGGTGTSPANVSKVYFSDRMILNHAATNPVFSFLSSAVQSDDGLYDYEYYTEDERAALFEPLRGDTAPGDEIPELLTTRRPNVVLILLESFGRTITDETVGGEQVTPNLNRLKGEGIWFENIYANSFRTDRGQVAVMSGYPAQPVMSVMKLPHKAQTLPAIARSLQREGYATSFTYGGDADFTNTVSYLYGTGVERITDQRDMRFDVAPAQWGYADDVVCPLFAREVEQLAAGNRPFFATLLTLSSHEPFDVPYHRLENKILNAASFTDECVARMIDTWRGTPIWDNLLVILVADHGIGYPEGLDAGSVARQRIPMLWLGGAVRQPSVVETYASQSDLAATLLSQMGIGLDGFTFSRDIFDPARPHFGFWTFNNGFGMISECGHVIYDCTGDRIVESAGDSACVDGFVRNGKALLQTIHKDIRER